MSNPEVLNALRSKRGDMEAASQLRELRLDDRGHVAQAVDTAISRFTRRTFRLSDRDLTVAVLVRSVDWKPLRAPWWKKKEACIIGADLDGNFFLRHCDGSVRYWEHATQTDTIIANSVRDFCASLIDTPW